MFIPFKAGMWTTGICGNCNGILDDYRKKDGTDVSGLQPQDRDNEIGNSWWVPEQNAAEYE